MRTTASRPSLDLNLLVVFEALWIERSVTAAGRRLGLSQPATSGALARLRTALGDRLFVRVPSGLEPTDRCIELAEPLCRTLVELRNVVAGSSFEPTTSTRCLRVGAVDAAIAVVLPSVLARTMREAPGMQVQVSSIDPTTATEALLSGKLDIALAPLPNPSASVRSRALYPIEFAMVTRPGHPLRLTERTLTREQLDPYPRVHVSFQGASEVKAAVVLSSYLAVPAVLASSDAWSLVPRRYAELLARSGQIDLAAVPQGLTHPTLKMQLLWPDAHDAAPASRWLRALIVEAIGTPSRRGPG